MTKPVIAATEHVRGNTDDPEPVCGSLADVTVIIPALDEERSLPLVLAALPAVGEVIVVDNGSSDLTAEVAAARGATVVHESRRGYGSACLRGLASVREAQLTGERSPRVIAFVDADYSDAPELLPRLVQPIFDGEADLVLGSRLAGKREPGAMPPQSVLGNRFACFLVRWLLGATYSDLGPFRAIDAGSLRMLGMTDRDFGWTVEMQIKAARFGLRTREIPVPYRCRAAGRSKISRSVTGTLRAGCKILWLVARYGMFDRRGPGR